MPLHIGLVGIIAFTTCFAGANMADFAHVDAGYPWAVFDDERSTAGKGTAIARHGVEALNGPDRRLGIGLARYSDLDGDLDQHGDQRGNWRVKVDFNARRLKADHKRVARLLVISSERFALSPPSRDRMDI